MDKNQALRDLPMILEEVQMQQMQFQNNLMLILDQGSSPSLLNSKDSQVTSKTTLLSMAKPRRKPDVGSDSKQSAAQRPRDDHGPPRD